MMMKSPKKTHLAGIDETVLENKILVIAARYREHEVQCFGYVITLQKVLDYVRSTRDADPVDIDQMVRWYGEDECLLSDSDYVEIFADQEVADRADEQYCNRSNELDNKTDEWLYVMMAGSYITRFLCELPEKADYLC